MAMFDFTKLVDTFDKQAEAAAAVDDAQLKKRTRDIALEDEAARKAKTVADQAAASAEVTRRKQTDILGGIDGQLTKAQEAIRLSDSQNPMDKIQLYLLQQSDPSYTRDGNIRAMEYYQAAAGAVGGIEAIQQDSFNAQIKQIDNELQMAKQDGAGDLEILGLLEQQGQERLNAYVQAQAAMAGTLQNQVSMQDNALTQLPDEALAAAVEEAKKSESKMVPIGGVNVPLAALEDRMLKIEDRNYNRGVRQLAMADQALQDMNPDDMVTAIDTAKKDGFAMVGGTRVSVGRLLERQAALQSREFAQTQMQYQLGEIGTNLRQKAERNMLATFNAEELQRTYLNGGVAPDGQKYEPALVKEVYDQMKQVQDDRTTMDLARLQMGDPTKSLHEHVSYLDSLKAPEGSIMAQVIRDAKSRAFVAQGAGDKRGWDDTSVVTAATVLQADRAAVDEAVTQTAKSMSAGDKDMEVLYNFSLRNQPLPEDVLTRIISERVAKKKPITQFVSGESAAAFQGAYNAVKSDIALTGTMDDGTVESMALEAGFKMLKRQASTGFTDQFFGGVAMDPSGPLAKAGITGTDLLVTMKRAEEEGTRMFLQQSGMSEQDFAKAAASGQLPPELQNMQDARLLAALDQKQGGLGQAYVKWWNSENRDKYVQNFVAAKYGEASSIKQQAEYGLVLPDMANLGASVAVSLTSGAQFLVGDDLTKSNMLYSTFGIDPRIKQAFLLEQDKTLTPFEKQTAITFMQPWFDSIKAQKMNPQQAAQFIEGQIMSADVSDPKIASTLKKIRANRADSLKVVEDFLKANRMVYTNLYGSYGREEARVGSPDGFDWLDQMDGKK